MLGTLDREQIDRLLHSEVVGRIGVHADGRTYVVPVSYVYDGDAVYVHSLDGMKVRMLRAAEQVCFEVDHIKDLGNWQSVVAWGPYEELAGDLATAAMNLLASRLAPVTAARPRARRGQTRQRVAARSRSVSASTNGRAATRRAEAG